ncbi:hypothetical protein LY76DRAFT_370156 [Colletotrichum caudatum]|nr:hypothetical protein LY76DRAFT_370156 [Colletotrichum caudatum]
MHQPVAGDFDHVTLCARVLQCVGSPAARHSTTAAASSTFGQLPTPARPSRWVRSAFHVCSWLTPYYLAQLLVSLGHAAGLTLEPVDPIRRFLSVSQLFSRSVIR